MQFLFKLRTDNIKEAERKTIEMIKDLGGTYGRKLTFVQPNEGTVREDLTQVFSILKYIAITGLVREGRDCSRLMANVRTCSCGSPFSSALSFEPGITPISYLTSYR